VLPGGEKRGFTIFNAHTLPMKLLHLLHLSRDLLYREINAQVFTMQQMILANHVLLPLLLKKVKVTQLHSPARFSTGIHYLNDLYTTQSIISKVAGL